MRPCYTDVTVIICIEVWRSLASAISVFLLQKYPPRRLYQLPIFCQPQFICTRCTVRVCDIYPTDHYQPNGPYSRRKNILHYLLLLTIWRRYRVKYRYHRQILILALRIEISIQVKIPFLRLKFMKKKKQ